MALQFADLWRWDGRVNGKTYAFVGIVGVAIKHVVDHLIAAGFFHSYGFFNYWAPLGRGAHLTRLTANEGKFLSTMLLDPRGDCRPRPRRYASLHFLDGTISGAHRSLGRTPLAEVRCYSQSCAIE
jgi:hypothetical protein